VENYKLFKMFDATTIFVLEYFTMSKTFNPKKTKRRKKHGFLKRMGSSGGRRIIKRRRQKSRRQLAV
jgi:large subunit ribosomal protein L34